MVESCSDWTDSLSKSKPERWPLNAPTSFRRATKISGMAHGAIGESLDRITGAFAKNNLPETLVEVLVNLAPADLPKEGTWLDLPLAIILLQAAGIVPDLPDHLEGDFILMGELGLHGEIRRIPGALSIASVAKPGQSLIVPAGNEKECALILAKAGYEGCNVYAVSTLAEVIEFFHGRRKLQNALKEPVKFENAIPKCIDFGKIRGQQKAKDAAVIAAAGGHNMLLIGPPGEGKSLLASAIPGVLPRLQNGEKVDLTKIYSACGVLGQDGVAVTRRPFRSIHHTASKQSLVGGGSKVPRPGEITLAHLGVLFLDEIAEFSASTLEAPPTADRGGRDLYQSSWRQHHLSVPFHIGRSNESVPLWLLWDGYVPLQTGRCCQVPEQDQRPNSRPHRPASGVGAPDDRRTFRGAGGRRIATPPIRSPGRTRTAGESLSGNGDSAQRSHSGRTGPSILQFLSGWIFTLQNGGGQKHDDDPYDGPARQSCENRRRLGGKRRARARTRR